MIRAYNAIPVARRFNRFGSLAFEVRSWADAMDVVAACGYALRECGYKLDHDLRGKFVKSYEVRPVRRTCPDGSVEARIELPTVDRLGHRIGWLLLTMEEG